MNSKMTAAKPTYKRVLFRKWQLVAAAVICVILWGVWGVTGRGLDLALNTTPRYFPEAPLWHIALFMGGALALAYSNIGMAYLWLKWVDRHKNLSEQ